MVDADALEKKLHELALDDWNQGVSTSWSNAYLECEDMVYNAQTVDAVEVVRCKDCEWWNSKEETCIEIGGLWRSSDFCSWGERKEDASKID